MFLEKEEDITIVNAVGIKRSRNFRLNEIKFASANEERPRKKQLFFSNDKTTL